MARWLVVIFNVAPGDEDGNQDRGLAGVVGHGIRSESELVMG